MEKKDHIDGIYNYCDRWCEKCTFTSNCYLFTMESKIASHEILNNEESSKSADSFSFEEIFDEEFFPDEEDDNDMSIDSDSEHIDEDQYDPGEEDEMQIENPPLGRNLNINKTLLEELSYEYLTKAHSLIEKLAAKFPVLQNRSPEEIKDSFLVDEDLYLPEDQVIFREKIFNNFDIISWYHTFQYPKFKRALSDKEDVTNEEDDKMEEIYSYDMNGTAKIAIISVNKSIKSLNELYDQIPEYNTEIEELLVILGKLLNEAEKEFPDYKKFKRPGFDD